VQILFDYVLFHFKQVYQLPEPLEMSYGIDGRSRVQVTKTTSDFFAQEQPQPEQITWKDWTGTSLPLVFAPFSESDWFYRDALGNLVVQEDLIAASFFFLSGWQEYHSTTRDPFGRYPFAASLQATHGFVTKPVVNYYFEVLKTAVELAYGQKVEPKKGHGKTFTTCLTHDIDYCQSAWKVAGKQALLKGNLGRFLQLAWRKAKGKDAWFNFAQVQQELQKLNAPATFFFLPEKAKYQSYPNADYDLLSPRLQSEIRQLQENGHEIALHGSHASGTNANQLQLEKAKLPASVTGNRFHYLRFDPVRSSALLEQLNFKYDSSLGFPEHFGFRNSYCHPFRLFDFKAQRMTQTWELPLNLMDITLNHPYYLQLAPADVLPALMPMLEEIIRFRGVFTLLWHNENFTPYGMESGLELFRQITRYVQNQNTAFLTAQQILAAQEAH
jgi:peptidoglycan/xylan/chitin deacetylase (PgdA/CDA1 family)